MNIEKTEQMETAYTQAPFHSKEPSNTATPKTSAYGPRLSNLKALDQKRQVSIPETPVQEQDSESALAFIRKHGARAYAEELQNRVAEGIRQKILQLMDLSEVSLSEMSLLQRQTIEGLIAVEMQARLEASSSMASDSASDNSIYLKALMLTQGNYGFFNGHAAHTLSEFKEFMLGNSAESALHADKA